MKKFDRSKYANCESCPYRFKKAVSTIVEAEKVNIAIIGDHPTSDEDKPFTNSYNSFFRSGLHKVGLQPFGIMFLNVIGCPPDTYSHVDPYAISCCSTGLQKEIEWFKSQGEGQKIFIPTSDDSLNALHLPTKLHKLRGSVLTVDDNSIAIPTFPGSYLLRSDMTEQVVFLSDLDKVKTIRESGYKPLEENFIIKPDLGHLQFILQNIYDERTMIGVDIETFGLDPKIAEIRCIGISWDETHAVVIPMPIERYYNEETKGMLEMVLEENPVVIHNALFDVNFLAANNYHINNLVHDTMLLSHAIHPELKHNLGFVTSLYGKTPYWKDVKDSDDKAMLTVPDDVLFPYNARDCVTMLQILPEMLKNVEPKALEVYQNITMKMIPVLLKMQNNGILVDQKGLSKWKLELLKEIEEIKIEIIQRFELPKEFSFGGHALSYFIFGKKPDSLEDKKIKYSICKNRKTKSALKLKEEIDVIEETTPLRLPKYTPTKTDKGKAAFDDKGRLSLKRACLNRLEIMDSLVRGYDKKEKKNLEDILWFIEKYDRMQELQKLESTYTKYKLDENNRVHTQFKLHGTVTGRLSSSSPNLQNVPKECRKLFIVPNKRSLIEADYENLELRVLAYVCNDKTMIKMFEEGLNIHDENTKMIFGINEKDTNWKRCRAIEKMYIFGRNYGGGLEGMYERMMQADSTLRLTLKELREIDKAYFKLHPEYAIWFEQTKANLIKTRHSENLFGRIRIFLGRDDAIIREGLNFEIQSTGADLVSRALIELDKALPLDWKLILTVHDSIMLEVPDEDVNEAVKLLREVMEKTQTTGKLKGVNFRTEIKTGECWGTLVKV
jgi:DNA polymerase I-like protein with 3'-5' exonuclease and polymerase domains